jgi:hypothetical protein
MEREERTREVKKRREGKQIKKNRRRKRRGEAKREEVMLGLGWLRLGCVR